MEICKEGEVGKCLTKYGFKEDWVEWISHVWDVETSLEKDMGKDENENFKEIDQDEIEKDEMTDEVVKVSWSKEDW